MERKAWMSHALESAVLAAVAGAGPMAAAQDLTREQVSSVVCGAGWIFGEADRRAPVLDGIGDIHFPITTRSAEAQRMFDQGMALVWAFNHEEAWRTFKEVARLDPDCAMAYWGIAYTLGGNYNVPGSPERLETAARAIQIAKSLRPRTTPKEQALIGAMLTRYATPVPEDAEARKALDRAYADAMREVAAKYPEDDDVMVMYAESMMNLRPWALWSHEGEPEEGTPEILATLDRVIKRNPRHTGANHLAIHAWEASPTPERALASADRLGSLAPRAGHLVHMPSHIYIRTGMFERGADSNRAAIAADDAYLSEIGGGYIYGGLYAPHNWHFLVTCCSFIGLPDEAIETAEEMRRRANVEALREAPGADFVINQTWLTRARFGMWSDVLEDAAPPEGFMWAKASWHFARGRAMVGQGDLEAAKRELAMLEHPDWMPEDAPGPYGTNTARGLVAIAADVLGARIAQGEGRADEAVEMLERAVVNEAALTYGEPPDWHAPSNETLGALHMEMAYAAHEDGDDATARTHAQKAEAAFRADMKMHPNNGWALHGLASALELRATLGAGDDVRQEAKRVRSTFREVWKGAQPPEWQWY
ncbi:MAG: hypothetical protein RBS39_01845 [Phycisphaerales bacterium]|jgi:tetratricopeptide (TPR) repeat protein|nr:hypothetical protein [Phycisphaerales bacterium]